MIVIYQRMICIKVVIFMYMTGIISSRTFHCIKGGQIEIGSYCIITIIRKQFSLIYPAIYLKQGLSNKLIIAKLKFFWCISWDNFMVSHLLSYHIQKDRISHYNAFWYFSLYSMILNTDNISVICNLAYFADSQMQI